MIINIGLIVWLGTLGGTLVISLLAIGVYKLFHTPRKKPKTMLEKVSVGFVSLPYEVEIINRLRAKKRQETIKVRAFFCHMLVCYMKLEATVGHIDLRGYKYGGRGNR